MFGVQIFAMKSNFLWCAHTFSFFLFPAENESCLIEVIIVDLKRTALMHHSPIRLKLQGNLQQI